MSGSMLVFGSVYNSFWPKKRQNNIAGRSGEKTGMCGESGVGVASMQFILFVNAFEAIPG